MDFCRFIHADFVIGINIKIIARVRLTENQIKDFQKGFNIAEGVFLLIVQIREIILNYSRQRMVIVSTPEKH